MMDIYWLLAGAILAAPLWIGLSLLAYRRIWRSARRMTSRAKGRNQLVELGQIAAGLAHELKNPLSTINLNLKLLGEDLSMFRDDAHGRVLRRLTSVQEEARRLNDILGDFLRFAGKYDLQLTPVDLRIVLNELADFFSPQADSARVVLRVTVPDSPVTCLLDTNLFKQALLNLMINAVDAMDSGGEMLIKLSLQRGKAMLEVIDTAGGIPDEVLNRIFDVYYSTKRSGSGLGLPTSRRIIREHDGTIQVQSEVGKGTRFIITLPCVRK